MNWGYFSLTGIVGVFLVQKYIQNRAVYGDCLSGDKVFLLSGLSGLSGVEGIWGGRFGDSLVTVSPPLGSLSWRALFSRLGLESGVSKGDGGYFEIPLLILGGIRHQALPPL